MCLDTSIWDPGTDDSSKLSAQEDTAAHTWIQYDSEGASS
jgi:hypothetical protein